MKTKTKTKMMTILKLSKRMNITVMKNKKKQIKAPPLSKLENATLSVSLSLWSACEWELEEVKIGAKEKRKRKERKLTIAIANVMAVAMNLIWSSWWVHVHNKPLSFGFVFCFDLGIVVKQCRKKMYFWDSDALEFVGYSYQVEFFKSW